MMKFETCKSPNIAFWTIEITSDKINRPALSIYIQPERFGLGVIFDLPFHLSIYFLCFTFVLWWKDISSEDAKKLLLGEK